MSRSYLVLDGGLINDLPQNLLRMEHFALCHPLYQSTAYEAIVECGPMLVEITTNETLQKLFRDKWRSDSGIWLESNSSHIELIEHLRSLVHVKLESGMTALFRYYDPRITRLWLTAMDTVQRDYLLGPIVLIRLPSNEDSEREQLIYRKGDAQPGKRYSDTPWLLLNGQQLDMLGQVQREQFSQHLLDHCQRYFPSALEGLDTKQRCQWAEGCRRNAERHGYTTDNQITRWVALYAALGENFPDGHEHAAYQSIIGDRFLSPELRMDNLLVELARQIILSKESGV
ncbi:DUF4123 domain-containing protein [Pseudomonas viridiflava]|uniref:DUF4123 domain-containing protein n=1 Tax=Pseudomonas viridiflava TaxID=33069 RepID=UPI0005B6E346|nr:DUF4123 domain-containing protein [Pseudomonas viridiflava]KIQ37857.1 hypothetical protein RT94_00280 [Pseudomonas viridiflava]